MKKILLSLLLCSALTFSYGALDFPKSGFSITPPDRTPPEDELITSAMFFLASKDGFASNVNVQVQPYPDSLEDYITLSKEQFAQMELTLQREKREGDNTWVVEYTGSMGTERSLRFYAKAIKKDSKVYLATATALDEHWKQDRDILIKSVNSLKVPE